MGLLNFGSSLDDPRTQGLLALGLGLMGGRGNFGQVLSQAGMQGLGAYQAGQDRVAAQKRSGLQQAMLEMQMAAAKRAAEQEERDRALLAEYSMPRFAPGASVMKPGSMAQGPLPLNPMEVLQKGGSMPLLQQLSSLQTMGLPKVARTVEVDDGKGGKATMQLDEFGRPVGQQLPGYVAPVQVNQGDKVTFARPQTGVSLPVGMSPSERDASARGWASNRLANDRFSWEQTQAGSGNKPPQGYRWKPDGSLEAIPGGPADIKATADGQKAEKRKELALASAENVLGIVNEAKNLVGPLTAGGGSLMARIPATPARDLQAKLETVKANLGFDRLQAMREASPTGGALGAVAVQELTALQSTVASLDQAQSPAQLASALEKIEMHYGNWMDVMSGNPLGTFARSRKPKAAPTSREDLLKSADDIVRDAMRGR